MKKRILLIEMLLIIFFFVLPPLLAANANSSANIKSFSYIILIEFLVAFLLEFQYRKFFKSSKNQNYLKTLILSLKWNAICLASLMIIYAIFEFIYIFFLKTDFSQNAQIIPQNFLQWIFLILSFISSAFFEEEIYRQFLPQSLIFFTEFLFSKSKSNLNSNVFFDNSNLQNNSDFLNNQNLQNNFNSIKVSKSEKIQNIIIFFIEFLCVTIFAFSHRYLGFISVFNAFFCGIILRITCKKTNSIMPGMIAHFSYNFILILFNFFMNSKV